MPSSTSNSETVGPGTPPPGAASLPGPARGSSRGSTTARGGIIALLAGLVLIFLFLEVSSPMILARLSHTEQRITVETKAAKQLRPLSPDGRPTVLFVGNSLLLEGVQMDRLQEQTPQYAVSRLDVEQTHYLDWYFGLRRLLREGTKPSMIVVALATDQLASRFTLDEAFAHRQMSTSDFPRVVREVGLDRTTATSYFFAHWSNWQADKGFIRQCVMILVIPNFRELAAHIADHGPHVSDPAVLVGMARQRLPELAELSRQYGVQIVLLVPPTLRPDHSAEIQQIGDKAGVPVWVLSPPGDFPPSYFRDGFHLNTVGAGIFTARLSKQLGALPVPPQRPNKTNP